MFLNIEQHNSLKLAVKDNEENALNYGELVSEVRTISKHVTGRSVVFLLCKNTVGSLVGYLGFVEGGAVRVVDGKVDMENVKPKYECDTCGVFYREVLMSGFYVPFPQEDDDKIS